MTNPNTSPQIGDLRVTFEKVPCSDATVLALQSGNSFRALTYAMIPKGCRWPGSSPPQKVNLEEPLLSKSAKSAGPCSCVGSCFAAGEEVNEICESHQTAGTMMDRAENAQSLIHRVILILGYFMFFIGFFLQFKFVPTFFRIIPFVGTWIQYFGNAIAWVAAFFCGCFWWCGTLAFSWLFSRPLRAVLLFSAAVAMMAIPTVLSHHEH